MKFTAFFFIPTLILILIISSFLYFFRLQELMPFFGDIGWFYLSARDLILHGDIPLVGIPSSHPWLHQGAYWTYLLAVALKLGNFHPVSGGILAVLIGLLTVVAMYLFGKKTYSSEVGLLAAALYATSPLVIMHARMPYHTSPIPLFTIVYMYCVYKWYSNKIHFFPLSILFLAILYNFEIATLILAFPLVALFMYGIYRKKEFATRLVSIKNFLYSMLAFSIPMLPMLLYDVTHGFPQTIKVVMWIGYRVLVLFGYPPLHPEIKGSSIIEFFSFNMIYLSKLLFAKSEVLAVILFITCVVYFGSNVYSEYKEKKVRKHNAILLLWLLFGLGGYLANRVISEAYLPMIFPIVILLAALFIDYLLKRKKVIGLVLFFLVIISNLVSIPKNLNRSSPLSERIRITENIIKDTGNTPYRLQGKGEGSQFPSFTMSYEYLLWWKGHSPTNNAPTMVLISEENGIEYKIQRESGLQ